MSKRTSNATSFGNFLLSLIIVISFIGLSMLTTVVIASATGKENELFEALGINTSVQNDENIEPTELSFVNPSLVEQEYENTSPLEGLGEDSDGFTIEPLPDVTEKIETEIIERSATQTPSQKSNKKKPNKELIELQPISQSGLIGQSGLMPGTPIAVMRDKQNNRIYYDSCTIAFSLPGKRGFPFAITAGHCGNVGDKVYATPSGEGLPQYLGTVRKVSISSYDKQTKKKSGDWSLISLDKNAVHPPFPSVVPLAIDVNPVEIGTPLCKYGSTSQYNCGKKSEHQVSASIKGTEGKNQGKQLSALQDAVSLCALPGDSGGPVFSKKGIVGVLSATTATQEAMEKGSCKGVTNAEAFYVPVEEVLKEVKSVTKYVDTKGVS